MKRNSKNMELDTIFCEDLWNKTLNAISQGQKALLFWGFNDVSIEILLRLSNRGLTSLVSGIVDPEPRFQGLRISNFRVMSLELIAGLQVDTLVITVDELKEEVLYSFVRLDTRMPLVLMAGTRHLEFRDSGFSEVMSSCLVPSRAWGYPHMLIHIYQCLEYIAKRRLEGDIAEFGVYKAGTTVFIAKAAKRLGIDAKIYAFDTFSGFPGRKSLLDLYEDPHDEFTDFSAVEGYCRPFSIELVRGDITDTYRRIEGVPLVLSFFDTDNYTPTRNALEMCYEQTVRGGIIVCDHYFCDSRWLNTLGERIAVKETLAGKDIFNLHGTGIFIRL